MSAWSDMMLPKALLRGLYEKGFFTPMPIQSLVIPEAIKNKSNIIGTAQTVRSMFELKFNRCNFIKSKNVQNPREVAKLWRLVFQF